MYFDPCKDSGQREFYSKELKWRFGGGGGDFEVSIDEATWEN